MTWSCILFQLLLLGKAVVVAVLGEDRLLPPPPPPSHSPPVAAFAGDGGGIGGVSDASNVGGNVGLLCMYVSIVGALLASFVEHWLAVRLVGEQRQRHEGRGRGASGSGGGGGSADASRPLLSKDAGGLGEVRGRACT